MESSDDFLLDLRCETNYASHHPHHRPASHMSENARGYFFEKTQIASGFFNRIFHRHPAGTRLLCIGGGRTRPPLGDLDLLNIDFDPEAFRPLILADLHSMPVELSAEPDVSINRAFMRARSETESIQREQLAALHDVLREKEIGGCCITLTLQYLRSRTRRQLLGLCIAALREGGTLYISDRHPLHFPPENRQLGFEEARETAAAWGNSLAVHEYYRVPLLTLPMRRKITVATEGLVGQVPQEQCERIFDIVNNAKFISIPYTPDLDQKSVIELDVPQGRCLGLASAHHVMEIKKMKQ